jgi:hypothetical protein
MANAKKKQSGLGAESYFQNLPALGSQPASQGEVSVPVQPTQAVQEPVADEKKKVRKTYALNEDTHLALEELRLVERKKGRHVTLGDLMEEAVQLLLEQKLPAKQS